MKNYKYKHLGYYYHPDDISHLRELKSPETMVDYYLNGQGYFRDNDLFRENVLGETDSDLQTLQRVPTALSAYDGKYYVDFSEPVQEEFIYPGTFDQRYFRLFKCLVDIYLRIDE